MLAVTNTVGSSLAREADAVMYTHAGPEIGVAATKTFSTQMVALHLVALYLAQVRGAMFPVEIVEIVERMRELPEQVERTLELDGQVRDDRRGAPRRARRPVHRPAHGVPGRARGRAEAEGDLATSTPRATRPAS